MVDKSFPRWTRTEFQGAVGKLDQFALDSGKYLILMVEFVKEMFAQEACSQKLARNGTGEGSIKGGKQIVKL